MKMALIDSKAYFRINPPCPAFWGVAPRTMKIGRSLKLYFLTNYEKANPKRLPPWSRGRLGSVLSDLRIKFYAQWIEFLGEHDIDPVQTGHLQNFANSFWFRLVRVG
jgi:hypothetical protein